VFDTVREFASITGDVGDIPQEVALDGVLHGLKAPVAKGIDDLRIGSCPGLNLYSTALAGHKLLANGLSLFG